MNVEALLDDVEHWLENNGTISGVPFSEHGLLERLRDHRPKEKRAGNKNGMDMIPEMTDAYGKHWKQPDRQMIFFRDGQAHVSAEDNKLLSSYDSSMPSGVYPGKMWKRTNGATTYLCWYGEEKDGKCSIHYVPMMVS